MRCGKLICVLVLLLLVYCGQLSAKPVSVEKAQQAVKGWLKADARPLGATLGQKLKKTDTFRDERGQIIYYVVYLQPSGFVIVPADDTLEPVLAFSDHGTYNSSLDNPLGALVNKDVRGRFAASREISANPGLKTQSLQEKMSKWEHLAASGQQFSGPSLLGMATISDLRVDPLLKTKWGQTTCCNEPNLEKLACYNYYTPLSDPWDPCDYNIVSFPGTPNPYGDPNNYPCGCVATAMAQLMRFHEHPQAGIGKVQRWITVGGLWNGEWAWTRGGDGWGGRYYWDRMVYEPNCDTNDLFRQAIGALCYDAGVSVKMNYSPNASWALLSDVNIAFVDVFMYTNAIYKSAPNPPNPMPIQALKIMINPNLDYGHPVIIGFGQYDNGHAVVADGYGYAWVAPNWTIYHHLNMGWEGAQDAWYNFYTDMPAGYNSVDDCVYNIFKSGAGEIISGRVTDAAGNAIAGATVTAVDQATLLTYQATTNNRGIYALAPLPSASTYTINVTKRYYSFNSKVVNTGTSTHNGGVGNVWSVDFTAVVCYVDENAPGDSNNDGSSWRNAYHYLRDAIDDPNARMIWVADGTYYPDSNSAEPNGSGDRNASFVLKNGVAMYGGFAGYGAPNPDARDIQLYETILSGDLNENDVYVADPCNLLNDPCRAENSYNVVTSNGTDANTILDGFTITAGNANTLSVWPTSNGGGMLNVDSSCIVNNCTFLENSAEIGGAIQNYNSKSNISNCTFFRNSARYDGGGVANDGASCPAIVNCSFTSNYAGNNGGGMRNWGQSSPTVVNCSFNHNSTKYGGGVRNFNNCSPALINCTLRGNWATVAGGGMQDNNNSNPTITNCIFWDNNAPTGPQIGETLKSAAIVSYSDIKGGWAGVGNINADPLFVDANGPDGIIGTEDDNLRLPPDSPCIDKGNNASVPADTTDLDDDANITEQTPLDLDNNPRFADGDCNSTIIVDMGAYEFGYFFCYVDKDAPGSNDGSNWYNAYRHLQDALADPCAPVIWVAEGTYYPDSNSSEPNGSGDRTASFVLKNGVAIYGGFAGFGSPNPNARNVELYETILSGDLNENDAYVADPCNLLTELTRLENSYHVVKGGNTNRTAILDGFTITAGNADSGAWPNCNGGGMFNDYDANCIVNNCTFVENSSGGGGAMWNGSSSLQVSNCTFFRNAGGYGGGGIANCVSSPTIVNCRFISNKGTDPGNNAGALYNIQNCNPVITNCLFVNNSAQYGGAISNIHVSYPTITNCTFRGNLASGGVGGINDYNNAGALIANCVLWDNTAPQINDGLGSVATVNYSDVQGGWGGAGVGNINADPRFVDANGQDGVIGTLDDNLRLLSSSPCIDKGSNAGVPADTADLDSDGNTTEQTPLDLDLRPRFADGNCDGNSVVDMGAYEFSYAYAGDFDNDCDVDFIDFAILANSWLQNNPLVDIAPPPEGDGIVDIKDLAVLCDNWLAGK